MLTFRMPAAICLLSSKGLRIVCNQQTKEQSASAYLKSQAIINIIGGYCFSQKLFADSLFWFDWFFWKFLNVIHSPLDSKHSLVPFCLQRLFKDARRCCISQPVLLRCMHSFWSCIYAPFMSMIYFAAKVFELVDLVHLMQLLKKQLNCWSRLSVWLIIILLLFVLLSMWMWFNIFW